MAGAIKKFIPEIAPAGQKLFSFEERPRPRGVKRAADYGLMFDIDGVITRGRTLLPNSKPAFKHLTDEAGKFLLPVCFVTNAGHTTSVIKAKQLSDLLEIQVEPHQVVMSHTPLKMFKRSHHRRMLISGQGPIKTIAESLGYTNTITMEEFGNCFPTLDTMDHNRPKITSSAPESELEKIQGVILFGEPTRWESSLQLILDVLITDGRPLEPVLKSVPYPHLPIYACNMDAVWMSEAPNPRFGHGCFLNCLESVYKKMTGHELKYAAQVGKPDELTYYFAENLLQSEARRLGLPMVRRMYCVGDNPAVDVYGANLFNKRVLNTVVKSLALRGKGPRYTVPHDGPKPRYEVDILSSTDAELRLSIERCQSILVRTGIYQGKPDENRQKFGFEKLFGRTTMEDFPTAVGEELDGWRLSPAENHVTDVALCKPSIPTVENVEDGVNIVLDLEAERNENESKETKAFNRVFC